MQSTPTLTPPRPTMSAEAGRQHRKQVSRACDWCRSRRKKCDNGRPCHACRAMGSPCTMGGVERPRSLPMALKEIDSLADRVQTLQLEIDRLTLKGGGSAAKQTWSLVGNSPNLTTASDTSYKPDFLSKWEGIWVPCGRSDQAFYYGPASSAYFASRMGAYLSRTLQQPFVQSNAQPRGPSKNLATPTSQSNMPTLQNQHSNECSLSRTGEVYFLDLFWETHNTSLPIIDERAFLEHYESLWKPGGQQRKLSALVEMVLAISMQYGWTFLAGPHQPSPSYNDPGDDATIAGRWYYRRFQSLMNDELEVPSITTVQCLIFSAVYLSFASFQNISGSTIAQAIRAAQNIGLHRDPPADMPYTDKQLRRRVWHCLFTLECKMTMKLGKPSFVSKPDFTTARASDDPDAAAGQGSRLGQFHTEDDVTWLTYVCQCNRLVDTVNEIYRLFYSKCGATISQRGVPSPYNDAQTLEACAEHLNTSSLQTWLLQLPEGIKTRRGGGGDPFSTARTPLDIDTAVPSWLSRQRIWLESLYHTLQILLHRPFIAFSTQRSYTPRSEHLATICANHAIALVHIGYQVVRETDLMHGWTDFFSSQWNATVTLIGFSIAHPVHHSTISVREAVDNAIALFEILGTRFAVAQSAAVVAKDLMSQADRLVNELQAKMIVPDALPETNGDDFSAPAQGPALSDTDFFADLVDWTLSVDSFNDISDFLAFNPSDYT